MSDIVFIHWNDTEARERSQPLTEAGHRVRLHATENAKPPMPPLPEVLVISLDRLPSHGSTVAEWLWEAKSRRGIPIVFVGGAADKVSLMRAKFPSARFCARGALVSTVAAAARSAAALRGEFGEPKTESSAPKRPTEAPAKRTSTASAKSTKSPARASATARATKPAAARGATATAARPRRRSA
ncbi:MAG: hypothetical protein U0575_16600 [Phycisphaerales bacterium]